MDGETQISSTLSPFPHKLPEVWYGLQGTVASHTLVLSGSRVCPSLKEGLFSGIRGRKWTWRWQSGCSLCKSRLWRI